MSLKLLMRKINNVLSRGKMLELDVENRKVPVAKVGLMANEIWDGLEWAQDFGFKSFPPFEPIDDEEFSVEVQTAHFGGNRNHGTILKAFIRRLMPTLAPGESIMYNAFGLSVKLSADNEIIIKLGDDVLATLAVETVEEVTTLTVTSTANIVLDVPKVTITGDLVVDGTINTMILPPP